MTRNDEGLHKVCTQMTQFMMRPQDASPRKENSSPRLTLTAVCAVTGGAKRVRTTATNYCTGILLRLFDDKNVIMACVLRA